MTGSERKYLVDRVGDAAIVQVYADGFRDEIVTRVDALDLPSYSAFVMPRLEPVVDANGRITDVDISYPCDFEAQMLEYSELSSVHLQLEH